MERVFGEGRSGRGGKAIETGRMVKKKGSRRQECNRKLGVRRGDTGQGERREGKGGRKRPTDAGRQEDACLPNPTLDTPQSPTGSRHPNFGGTEEEREQIFTSGQGRDGWKLPTFIAPASLSMSQHVCLEKYPCYTEISLCIYI